MSKTTRTREEIREKILCEATKLFGERGFDGVALRDIAKACDIPLSTLSSHFARKQKLQEVVYQRAVETIIKRDLTARLATGTAKQRFRQYIVNVVELFLSDLPEMKMLDREFQELGKSSTSNLLLRTSRDKTSTDSMLFVAQLAKDTKSDILRSISAVHLTHMIFAAIYGIIKLRPLDRRLARRQRLSKAALTRHIVHMFERMLRI